jgi:choline-glycine betaine transporter
VGAAVDEFPAVACGREKRVGWFSSRFVFIFIFMIILIGVARLGGVGLGNSERE